MAAGAHAVRARVAARSNGPGIAAAALVAFHIVSTAALVTVMVDVRGGQAEERQMTQLMRALAISICGRLPPRLPGNYRELR
jgi:hypothetical protein